MTELSHAISVNLDDFLLHGTFGPFNRKMFRPELLQLLGPQDADCYRDLAVFGSIAFDLCGEHGPINQIQLLIPHVVHDDRPEVDVYESESGVSMFFEK